MSTPEPVRLFCGYDAREAIAYHACVQSLIEHSTTPLEIHPLALDNMREFYAERHQDGSNAFVYSRFLVPYLCGWSGYALFFDGDMLVRGDISELWNLRRPDRGVHVVKHDYRTRFPVKYFGAANPDYPRKNWSSVILWNCGFFPNRRLTPEFVGEKPGSYLHRFEWLADEQVEALPMAWNFLCDEQDPTGKEKLYHYTLGIPAIPGYENTHGADEWRATVDRLRAPMR